MSVANNPKPGGPDNEVVVIYLNLHGVVYVAGEPCLLLPDDDPLNCHEWLKVGKLFATIFGNTNTHDSEFRSSAKGTEYGFLRP